MLSEEKMHKYNLKTHFYFIFLHLVTFLSPAKIHSRYIVHMYIKFVPSYGDWYFYIWFRSL